MDNVFRLSEFVIVSRFSLRICMVCIDVLICCVSMKQALLGIRTIYPGTIHPGTIYPGTIYPGTIHPALYFAFNYRS